MNLTLHQASALAKVNSFLSTKAQPYFYLAGYAGTGKTTLAKYLAEGVEGEVLFAAFTGKAASVLREHGCPSARTLHSILYDGADDYIANRIKSLRSALATNLVLTEEERDGYKAELAELRKKHKGPFWKLNPESPLKTAKLLVLDECSMINRPLAEDALSFGTPILVLGDPAQLPPVHGAGYFTSEMPDFLLTEIHRQAADNPILALATAVRNGTKPPRFTAGKVRHHKKEHKAVDFANLGLATQVLTGKNLTRRALNRKRRGGEGAGALPTKGDKLVCLKNDREYGVLNGVICWAGDDAVRIDEEAVSLSVIYDGMLLEDMAVAAAPFDKYTDPETDCEFIDRDLQQFDYGYALTVHKAQGSQWEDVVIADDGFAKWDPGLRKRWLYTAITRASETLTIVE